MNKITVSDNNITSLPIDELRRKWAKLWGFQAHARIGRAMLEKSLEYKQRQLNGQGLKPEQKNDLII